MFTIDPIWLAFAMAATIVAALFYGILRRDAGLIVGIICVVLLLILGVAAFAVVQGRVIRSTRHEHEAKSAIVDETNADIAHTETHCRENGTEGTAVTH
jgi:uncharacterized protein YpmB